MKRVMLMTKADRAALLRAGVEAAKTGETADRATVKIFDPCGRFTFYVFDAEQDGDDLVLFGYTVSPIAEDCDEWGKASLAELEGVKNRMGLPLERDRYFDGVTKAQIHNGARP